MPALLEVRSLQAAYGSVPVLHGIDFDIEAGSVTTLLGANGAGKTTTLRAISGMLRLRGEIRLNGVSTVGLQTEDIARRGVAHVPDGRGTFLRQTVRDNLVLGAISRRDRAGIAGDIERIYGYFPILKRRSHQQAGTLSGGEQQMLAVGRALMIRPKLLLLDEPSFGLAPMIVEELFGILETLNRREHVTMLLVEQNAGLALALASRAYLLETGRIVFQGTPDEIRGNERVREAYLGQ